MKKMIQKTKKIMAVSVLALALVRVESPCAGGLTLEEAVRRALERSPVVSAAQQGLEGAKAREGQSFSALLPRVDFKESYLRTDQPVASFGSKLNQGRFTVEDFAIDRLNSPDTLENFQTKFTVSQSLFTGGRLHRYREMRQHERRASAWDLEAARAEIGFRTIEAYWGLSLARESEKVAETALMTAKESLRQIELLFEEGTVVRSDLLSAKVQTADFQDQLVRARGRTRVAERGLALLIGESEGGSWEVASLCPPGPEQTPDLDADRLLAVATKDRPEFAALKARWGSATAAVKAAKGNFLPSLGLEASYEWNSPDFASNQQGSYLLGLGVEWNLFKGLGDRAQLEEAKSGRQMLRYELQSLQDRITLEIEEAVVAVTTGQERLLVTRERVGQADESFRIVRQRYNEGLTNVVELQKAELVLSRSRLAWLRAVHDLWMALARLNLVTGQLVAGLPGLACAPRGGGTP